MSTDRLCQPVAEWPEADRQLWVDGLRERGLFDASTAGTNWSEQSRRKIAQGYGRWLHWLTATGRLESDWPPGRRVTKERVASYIRHLRETLAPYTVMSRIQDLHNALRLLAPEQDFAWLAELWGTLRSRAVAVRDKRSRLRPADNLAVLGFQLMRQAETALGWSPRRRAVAYRDGLMMALLAYRPVRLKNLAGMRLGQHLVEAGGGTWMMFAAAETKSRRPYEAVIPEAVEANLRRYLEHHRPVLLAGERGGIPGNTDAMWVSEIGTQLEIGALARRISMHTKRAFGRSIPPHWFRDAAATSIAIDDPVHVRDAHLVLGHASLATTENHYILAQSLLASRRHQSVLAQLLAANVSGMPTKPDRPVDEVDEIDRP